MASLSLQKIRDNVRSHLDVDTEELPDDLIDLYAQTGFDRIARAEQRWPFYETSAALITSANNQNYSFDITTVEAVREVSGPQWSLEYIDIDRAITQWPANYTGTGSPPTHYSIYHAENFTQIVVCLWPIPGGIYNHVVRGYRAPRDWIASGAGQAPDGPPEFSRLVQMWVLSEAYLQVGDYELAQTYQQRFDQGVAELRSRFMVSHPAPLTLNGDIDRVSSSLPPRLRYPWE